VGVGHRATGYGEGVEGFLSLNQKQTGEERSGGSGSENALRALRAFLLLVL
jgi:hypothetical protein